TPSRFKPIPDEEGTETGFALGVFWTLPRASNRSPMRRGLKRRGTLRDDLVRAGFKPIPDEEGTETPRPCASVGTVARFKPIPDEEGTERMLAEAARSLKEEPPSAVLLFMTRVDSALA
ncbi:MAG: hypothetical protein WA410_20480, partial [Candidatus Binatus sp.]